MKYFKWFCMVGLLLAVACEKEDEGRTRSISFSATIEQFRDPSDGQKIVLRNEQWIYWEIGDQISIGSDIADEATVGDLVNSSPGGDFADFSGIFVSTLDYGSTKFLGLHPYNENNSIEGKGNEYPYFKTPTLVLANEQPLRNDTTFSRSILPMVAWYGGNWDENDPTPFNLDFHNLSAIVRIQLFNSTGAPATIDHIDFTSVDDPTRGIVAKNLSGPFSVHDYTTENPHLGELGEGSKTVTITCGEEGLAFPANELKTFYLVLPAFGGRDVTTNLRIEMDVVTKDNTPLHCKKTFKAPTRRTGVTYMNAIGITEWNASTGADSIGLVGNGTPTRPFKIYTIRDLCYLRDHYNDDRRLNGQLITPNTYIKIMRSDIVLTRSNWTTGIRNFEGHLTSMSNSANPGIVDSCVDVPLFESISSGGVVEGLALKSAVTFTLTSGTGVSPFCYSNAGTIRNCVITTIPGASSKVNLAGSSSFAGICVINSGTIEGCRFGGKAEVQEGKNFAGICLQNKNTGTIKGCQISSPAAMTFASNGSTAAGICYENQAGGTVRDSYFAADITGSTINWAGIVYENSGTVEHCYFSSTGHIYTSKEVGGIVRTNKGASSKIDYCWLEGPLRGKIMGGIVDSLAAGTVINCFTQLNAMITIQNATDIGGGLVARMTGGSIENSYVNEFYLQVENANATFGGIVGKATGGSVTNCYDKENRNVFYGTTSGTTYNRCYLVDGSQANINPVSSSTANAYTTLQGNLNVDVPTGGKGWTGAGGNTTPPVLESYTMP